jgi:rhodanese-related sulfurtransferase
VELGISARETHEKVQGGAPGVLFVDVRDPVEIMFIGFTDSAHANIPYLMVDRAQWDDKRGVFRLYQNPDFVAQIKAELARRGLGADAEIITMCRSGSERGEPSARFLRDNGFPNARYVVNGFQGGGDQGRAAGRSSPPERLAEQWPAVERQDEPGQDPPRRSPAGQLMAGRPWRHRAIIIGFCNVRNARGMQFRRATQVKPFGTRKFR